MEKVEPQAQAQTPHVVFLPFPALGHVKPLLKLAELLSHASFQVTFVNTEHVNDNLLSSIDIHAFSRRFPDFRFVSIPDGLPRDHPRSGYSIRDFLVSVRDAAKPAVVEVLVSLGSRRGGRNPTCIIADGIMSCAAIDAGEEFGIPVLAFRTYSACCTWTYFHLLKIAEEEKLPLQDQDMDKLVTCIPGLENVFRRRDLPGICRHEKPDDTLFQFFIIQASAMRRASALILNTFSELETPIISKLGSIYSKIYTIGPLHGLSNTRIKDDNTSTLASTKSIHWQEEKGCLTWLDSQPSKSVVLVSFGSLVTFTCDQMLEFWHGLINSEKPFLWVIRSNSIIDHGASQMLMDLKEKTKDKGFIASWSPQEEVLAHSAVGVFLTHSGWNSTLESIYAGVPMICWPALVDQQVNSRCVSDVWRVGFDMKDCCDRSIVERMVRGLMEGESEEVKTIEVISKRARESVVEGGSSYCNLEKLIEDIMAINMKTL